MRELEHLEYSAKIRHWMRDDAWSPGGVTLRFENPVYKIGDVLMLDGNITRAKPLIGRPCFGIATALLRYEHATRFVKGRGVVPTGRCSNCKAKEACRWVVNARLRSHPDLERAWTAWLQAGGAHAFSMPHFKKSHAYRCWMALYRALAQHPFTSVNDEHVAEAYLQQDRDRREKERLRKAKARRAARRTGEIDEHDEKLLKDARKRRGSVFVEAKQSDDCPKEIKRVPGTSLVELLDVWLAREILRARRVKPSLGNIARLLVDQGKSDKPKADAALETRVHRDLNRIRKLEKVLWRGKPLLPPLDRKTEFPSDLES